MELGYSCSCSRTQDSQVVEHNPHMLVDCTAEVAAAGHTCNWADSYIRVQGQVLELCKLGYTLVAQQESRLRPLHCNWAAAVVEAAGKVVVVAAEADHFVE